MFSSIKARNGQQITGRGRTPAKKSRNVSPVIGRPEGATLAVQERATDSSATPSGFAYFIHLSRGSTSAYNLISSSGFTIIRIIKIISF